MAGCLKLLLTRDYPDNCQPVLDYLFCDEKKPEWFNDPFVRKVIKEIDGAEVLFEEALKDRFGHGISPEKLSSTAKVVIMMYYFPDWVYTSCSFGVNAWPFINEVILSGKTITMIVDSHVFAEDIIGKGYNVFIDEELVTDDDTFYDRIVVYFDKVSKYVRELAYELGPEVH